MQSRVHTIGLSSAIITQWRDLHQRVGRFPFTDPAIFLAWWSCLGQRTGHEMHVTTVHDGDRLVAIAPQTVSRYKVLKVLQWAGGNDLGYCDALCESPEARIVLWRAVRRSRGYDIGLIKTLHSDTESSAYVGGFSRQLRNEVNYIVDVQWPSSAVWLKEEISAKTRKAFRNFENQIAAKAAVSYHIIQDGIIPVQVIDSMVAQKALWASQHQKSCMFDRAADAREMLLEIARATAGRSLHLAWLQAGDHVIATLLSLIHNDTMYFLITSYDPAFHKQSPGRLLLHKVFAWAIDNGIKKIDLMQGENEYKRNVANRSPITLKDYSFAGSILGRIAEPILARTYFKDRSAA